MARIFTALIFLASGAAPGMGNSFVEEVSCGSDSLTIMLNRNDPDLKNWFDNPNSQPVAYVYGHKSRTPCGVALKAPISAGSNQNLAGSNDGNDVVLQQPVFNFSIPYGPACNIVLTDLEPNHRTAETTIAIEDNAVTDESKNIRMNHVFCLYTRRAEALRLSDVQRGHEVVASVGGRPQPKVGLTFEGIDDSPLRAAKFGDTVKLRLHLDSDQAYKAILPKECMFSDHEIATRPGAKRLTFVQSQCPVKELSEIVAPLRELNDDTYYTQFKTFRFGNQTTVYAHCTVQVCLDPKECEKGCFTREPGLLSDPVPTFGPTSTIIPTSAQNGVTLTDERRRRRLLLTRRVKRAVDTNEVAITGALTILDENETREVLRPAYSTSDFNTHQNSPTANSNSPPATTCKQSPPWWLDGGSKNGIYILLIVLLCLALLFSLVAVCVLKNRLKLKKKEADLSGYSLTTRALSQNALGSVYSAWSPAGGNTNPNYGTPSCSIRSGTLPRRPVSIVTRCPSMSQQQFHHPNQIPVQMRRSNMALDTNDDAMRSVSELSVRPPVVRLANNGY